MVENRVERSGETSYERRYYISSAVLLALLFANAVRCHWQIENRLHWMLDVIFRGDLSRLRTGHGPHNTATVRHMVMNLPRSTKPGKSLKVRRKFAGWDPNYFSTILRGAEQAIFSSDSLWSPIVRLARRFPATPQCCRIACSRRAPSTSACRQ
jgi:predicted transposase YbfD/YdcC